jgi:hypothetical protein
MASYQLNSSGAIALQAASHVSINALQLSSPLAVSYGGTGGASGSAALVALGAQASSSGLSQIAALSPSNNQVISYNSGSSEWVAADAGVYSADGSTINLSGSTFSVASAGITATQLANSSVGASQLASSVCQSGGGISFNSGALELDSTVVRTSGNFSLAGELTLQNTTNYQVSGQSMEVECSNYEVKLTNATVTALATIPIPASDVLFAHADVACCSDDMAHYAQFSCDGVVQNNAGTISTGQLNNSSMYASDGGLACVWAVSGTNLVLNVTGLTSANIRFSGRVKLMLVPKYA